jgi:hypothetical protein
MPGRLTALTLITKNGTEATMRTEHHAVDSAVPAIDLAHGFAAALAAKDRGALRSLFGSEVDFRALTPGHVWEAHTPDALVDDVILGSWFEPSDVIQRIEDVQSGHVGSRTRIAYRLRVATGGRIFTVEQQAFCDLTDGKITWLRVLCSGFVPITGDESRPTVGPDVQREGNQS